MAALNGYTNVTTLADADEFVLWQSGAVVNMTWSAFRAVIDDWFLPLTGGSVTGNLVVDKAGAGTTALLDLKADSAVNAGVRVFEGGTLRGIFYWAAGTDTIQVGAYDATGTTLHVSLIGTHAGSTLLRYANNTRIETADHGVDVTGVVTQTPQYVTVTEAGSVTINDKVATAILSTAGTFSAFTITMPAAPVEGQRVRIAVRPTVTTLTHNPNTGQTLLGALTTSAGNAFGEWQWRASNSTWFRIG